MRKYDEPEIKAKVETALGMLLKNDAFLLEQDVNERSISHKLAEYLQQLFPDYHVDCEYNRIGSEKVDEKWIKKELKLDILDIKSNDEDASTVFPDIIVHKRGEKNNILVIEMKKAGRDSSKDKMKLVAYTSQQQLEYMLGCFIEITEIGCDIIEWYENGKKV